LVSEPVLDECGDKLEVLERNIMQDFDVNGVLDFP